MTRLSPCVVLVAASVALVGCTASISHPITSPEPANLGALYLAGALVWLMICSALLGAMAGSRPSVADWIAYPLIVLFALAAVGGTIALVSIGLRQMGIMP